MLTWNKDWSAIIYGCIVARLFDISLSISTQSYSPVIIGRPTYTEHEQIIPKPQNRANSHHVFRRPDCSTVRITNAFKVNYTVQESFRISAEQESGFLQSHAAFLLVSVNNLQEMQISINK